MLHFPSRRTANLIGFLACASMIAYALYAQYVLLLDPCPLCLFQRFEIIALGAVFLLAVVIDPKGVIGRVVALLIVIAAATALFTAGWHLWIQSRPPGSVPACGAGLSYLMDIMPLFDVIKKVFSGSGECQHVDTMLGLSWPWWTAISATALAIWGVATNWPWRRR
jgi:disulfide bond formation protein DsbB